MTIIQAGPDKLSWVLGDGLAALFQNDDKALEWNLIGWAEQFLDPKKMFLDVGAHVGTWALTYAKKVPSVVAIEAHYENFCRLVAGVTLNKLWNVHCHHGAAGHRGGGRTVTLNVGVNDWSGFGCSVENFPINGETRAETVPAIRIDDLDLGPVGLVKIGVEGHEQAVLMGLRRTLQRSGNPPILLECWSPAVFPWYAEGYARTQKMLDSLGYNSEPIAHWPHMLLCAHP